MSSVMAVLRLYFLLFLLRADSKSFFTVTLKHFSVSSLRKINLVIRQRGSIVAKNCLMIRAEFWWPVETKKKYNILIKHQFKCTVRDWISLWSTEQNIGLRFTVISDHIGLEELASISFLPAWHHASMVNSPFVYGGTNCTQGWNFADIFSRRVSKLWDFMTLLGHLFPKHWFKFYIDVLSNKFLATFLLHVPPVASCCCYSSCSGEVFHLAVSAADSCMRDVQMVPVGG